MTELKSAELRFFVKVDINERYPYQVVCFKNNRCFCVVRDMFVAKSICDMLNYNTAQTKRNYIFLLTACGALHTDFLKPSNIKKVSKEWLKQKYNQVLQMIEADFRTH